MAEAVLTAPHISLTDLSNFYAAHFSSTSVSHFADQFLGPVEEEEYAEEDEEDCLGYYEDGVKRTLTNEQIAIFRHSEIQGLLRDRRHAEEAREEGYESPPTAVVQDAIDEIQDGSPTAENVEPVAEGDLEDGELEEELSGPHVSTPQSQQNQSNKKNKRRKNKNAKKGEGPPQPKGFFKQNFKPDLRKRTWDKVDTGLDNLDYDENNSAVSGPNHSAQRRRISYNDD